MFTDGIDLTELHEVAKKIGMKRIWFQDDASTPHYDLVKSRRDKAISLGAKEVDYHEAVSIWRHRREIVAMRTRP